MWCYSSNSFKYDSVSRTTPAEKQKRTGTSQIALNSKQLSNDSELCFNFIAFMSFCRSVYLSFFLSFFLSSNCISCIFFLSFSLYLCCNFSFSHSLVSSITRCPLYTNLILTYSPHFSIQFHWLICYSWLIVLLCFLFSIGMTANRIHCLWIANQINFENVAQLIRILVIRICLYNDDSEK